MNNIAPGQAQVLATHSFAVQRISLQKEASVEEKEAAAIAAILRLFEQGRVVAVSFSGWKDSSVLMHLVLVAARRAQSAGLAPHVVVVSSDTRCANRATRPLGEFLLSQGRCGNVATLSARNPEAAGA